MPEFSVQHEELIMHCNWSRNYSGHVVLSGRVRGFQRLRCDMTATFNKHPDRFNKECTDVALNRLRQIAPEYQAANTEAS